MTGIGLEAGQYAVVGHASRGLPIAEAYAHRQWLEVRDVSTESGSRRGHVQIYTGTNREKILHDSSPPKLESG